MYMHHLMSTAPAHLHVRVQCPHTARISISAQSTDTILAFTPYTRANVRFRVGEVGRAKYDVHCVKIGNPLVQQCRTNTSGVAMLFVAHV